MRKPINAAKPSPCARPPARHAAADWRSLVEQIAELEDILTECGALADQDADRGRACLHEMLLDKRRQLRGIDVGVPTAVG